MRGYECVGDQMLQPGILDRKKGFTVGAELEELSKENELRKRRFMQGPNQWPAGDECPGFRETMLECFNATKGLSEVMFSLMAASLGLEERWFEGFVSSRDSKPWRLTSTLYSPAGRHILTTLKPSPFAELIDTHQRLPAWLLLHCLGRDRPTY